jgi:hypothetical protein
MRVRLNIGFLTPVLGGPGRTASPAFFRARGDTLGVSHVRQESNLRPTDRTFSTCEATKSGGCCSPAKPCDKGLARMLLLSVELGPAIFEWRKD